MAAGTKGWIRSAFIAVAVGLFALGAHCSAFSAAESTTPDGGSGVDSATPQLVDGSGDAPAPAIDGGDGGGRWCDTVDAAFCADFDELAVGVDDGWTRDVTDGGSLDRDTTTFFSAPGALRATAFADAPHAVLWHDLSSKTTALFRLMVRIEPGSHPYANIASLDFGVYRFSLAIGPSESLIRERDAADGGDIRHPLTARLDTGEWVAVEIAVQPGGPFSVRVDGVVAFQSPTNAAAPTAKFRARLGITFTDPSPAPWEVHFDNVRIDVQ